MDCGASGPFEVGPDAELSLCKKLRLGVYLLIQKPVFNLVEIELNSVLRVVCRMGTVPAPNRPVSFLGVLSRLGTGLRDRRRSITFRRATSVFTLGFVSVMTVIGFTSSPAFGAAAINLGNATPDAVVAGTTITNTGNSVLTGDMSLSPGTSITGFPPGTASGTTNAANATSLAAQTSATAAYGVAAGETPFTTLAGGLVGGLTLSPGVYTASSAMQLTGPVTLNAGGDASAVFIFQAGSTLTTASAASVVLEGGAQACNVYWQVGSSATLGSTTSFVGTILALASVTLNTGATRRRSGLRPDGSGDAGRQRHYRAHLQRCARSNHDTPPPPRRSPRLRPRRPRRPSLRSRPSRRRSRGHGYDS